MEPVTRQRWIERHYGVFLVLVIFFLGIFALTPHLVAYRSAAPGTSYLLDAYPFTPDANTYFTWIKQASSGDLLFNLKYTPEPTPHVIFHPVFLAMGLLVRVGIPLPVVWLGTQLLSIVAVVFAINTFIRQFFDSAARRAYALVLTCTAGGFGFLYYWTDRIPSTVSRPADIIMAEATVGRSLLWPFIFCFAIALMLWSLGALSRFVRTRELKYVAIAGGWGALLILIHPYDVVSLVVIGALYLTLEQGPRVWRTLLVFFMCLVPPVVYYRIVMMNKYFAETSAVPMQSPEVLSYVLGLGLLIPLALTGALLVMRKRWLYTMAHWRLGMVWLFITPLLVYAPIGFQRRLIQGWVIPLVIFSIVALAAVWDGIRARIKSRFVFVLPLLFVILLSGTFFTLLYNDVQRVRTFGFPLYLSDDMRNAMQWLSANSERSDVVLSSPELGNVIPRLSGNTVFIGHWAQTYQYSEKERLVERYFGSGMTAADRTTFLNSYAIRYVVVGPIERALGAASIIGRDPSLQRAFSNGSVTIYETVSTGST